MDTSARLGLPLIEPGQAQKEWFHNEALTLIDIGVQASVLAVGVDVPPAGPQPGACWIVGDAPGAAWAGRARAIAGWTTGGWRFVTAREGLAAWDAAGQQVVRFTDGAWRTGVLVAGQRVVGARQPAIVATAGGATIDTEARATLAAILTAMRAHGLISA